MCVYNFCSDPPLTRVPVSPYGCTYVHLKVRMNSIGTHKHKLIHLHTYLISFIATGGDDYTSGGYEVTFPAGSSTAQLTIDITDDNIPEPTTERFTARLSVSQSVSDLGASVGSDDTATVNIQDNDGECVDMAQAFFSSFFQIERKMKKKERPVAERIVQQVTGYTYTIIQANLLNAYTCIYHVQYLWE